MSKKKKLKPTPVAVKHSIGPDFSRFPESEESKKKGESPQFFTPDSAPEPIPVDIDAPPVAPSDSDTPNFSRLSSNMANAEIRAHNITKRLKDPTAHHRPDLELRLISPDVYPDAVEMGMVWEKVQKLDYFLEDPARNPFIFEQIVTSPTTTAFLLGRPAVGILWAHSIQRGYQAGVAMATWDRLGWGRTKEVQTAIRSTMRAHNLHRVFALVCMKNLLSLRFMKRLGFTQEGVVRQGLCYNGIWYDVALMGLLASETSSWGK